MAEILRELPHRPQKHRLLFGLLPQIVSQACSIYKIETAGPVRITRKSANTAKAVSSSSTLETLMPDAANDSYQASHFR